MIAQTILMQLGGRRFVAFTGSKQLTDMGNGLRMNLARNKTSANHLTSSMMEVQTFIICVSTARHSVKRPLRSR